MWFGRWRVNDVLFYDLKWVCKLWILGVYFLNGLVFVDNDNWCFKFDKFKFVLDLWS